MDWRSALVVVVFAVVAVVGGGIATKTVFLLVDRGSSISGAQTNQTVEKAASILRGGAWIGVLERLAIYAGFVYGWREALAIVIAIKGLGRYPELRSGANPAVAERFIIGTLMSVLWACASAGVAMWLR